MTDPTFGGGVGGGGMLGGGGGRAGTLGGGGGTAFASLAAAALNSAAAAAAAGVQSASGRFSFDYGVGPTSYQLPPDSPLAGGGGGGAGGGASPHHHHHHHHSHHHHSHKRVDPDPGRAPHHTGGNTNADGHINIHLHGGHGPAVSFAEGAGAKAAAGAAAAATPTVVRMRRGDAWAGFLSYEGAMQVCLSELTAGLAPPGGKAPRTSPRGGSVRWPRGGGGGTGASADASSSPSGSFSLPLHEACGVVPAVAASEFLQGGCAKLREAVGVASLLLPAPAGVAAAAGTNNGPTPSAATIGATELYWEDSDPSAAAAAGSRVSAGGFASSLTAIKLHVRRLAFPSDEGELLSALGVAGAAGGGCGSSKNWFPSLKGGKHPASPNQLALTTAIPLQPSPNGRCDSPTPGGGGAQGGALVKAIVPCIAGSRDDPVNGYQSRTVHLRLIPGGQRAAGNYGRSGLEGGYDVRTRLARGGTALPGSPVVDLLPGALGYDVVLEVSDGRQVLARGVVEAKRLWQAALEASGATGQDSQGAAAAAAAAAAANGGNGNNSAPMEAPLLVRVFNMGNGSDGGLVQLGLRCVDRELPCADEAASAEAQALLEGFSSAAALLGAGGAAAGPLAPTPGGTNGPGAAEGRVICATPSRAYDVLLDAALRAQGCGERRLRLRGGWAWLVAAFARSYGVRRAHCLLSHLRWALSPRVASATEGCLSLVAEGLRELLGQEERRQAAAMLGGGEVPSGDEQEAADGSGNGSSSSSPPPPLTRQEAAALDRVKRDSEQLLRLAFENYYLLCAGARKGLLEGSAAASAGAATAASAAANGAANATHHPQHPNNAAAEAAEGAADSAGNGPDFPPAALRAATELFGVMAPVLMPSAGEWMDDRLRVAAKARWARLSCAVDAAAAAALGAAASAASFSSASLGNGGPNYGAAVAHAFAAVPSHGEPNHASYARLVAMADAVLSDVAWDCRLQRADGGSLLPKGVNLPQATAAEHCTQYSAELRRALAAAPPTAPTPAAVALLVAVAGLQRRLGARGLAPPRGHPGHLDAMALFGGVVRGWISNTRDALLAEVRQIEATTELGAALGVGVASVAPSNAGGGGDAVCGAAANGGGAGGGGGKGGLLGTTATSVGGAAPIVGASLAAVEREMARYERVIAHWPLFGPYLEAALCAALRAAASAATRQCGGPAAPPPPSNQSSPSRPFALLGRGLGVGGGNSGRFDASPSDNHNSGNSGNGNGSNGPVPAIPRLFVREAALLNSLSRLMAAVPLLESRILSWTAEAWRACREAAAASPVPGGCKGGNGDASSADGAAAAAAAAAMALSPAAAAAACAFEDPAAYGLPPHPGPESVYGYGGYPGGYNASAAALNKDDDVAPQVGAQFAQAVKELRSEYALSVRAAAARLSSAVASRPSTSVPAILTAVWRDASAAAAAQLAGQQQAAAAARAANAPYAAAPSVEVRMFGAAQIGGVLQPGQAAALPGHHHHSHHHHHGQGLMGGAYGNGGGQAAAGGGGSAQSAHRALVERAAGPLLVALAGTLAALQEALEPRALVAVARALWDDQARSLLEYAEALQESGNGNGSQGASFGSGGLGGAWRARQHCSALLALLDAFFRDALVSVAGGGCGARVGGGGGVGGGVGGQAGELTERDLAAPVHSDAAARLLASSSTALNMAYTPV